MEDLDENKKKSSIVCEEKEFIDKIVDDIENKFVEIKFEVDKEIIKIDNEEIEINQEEKLEIRKSGRRIRNKEKKLKEEVKVKYVKKEIEVIEVKEKVEEFGLKIGDVKMKGKSELDISKKELSKKDDKDIFKRSSFLYKLDKIELLVK